MSSIKDEMWNVITDADGVLGIDSDEAANACEKVCLSKMADFAKWIKNKGIYGELIVTEDIWFDEDGEDIGDTEKLIQLYLNHTTNETSKG